MTYKDQLEKVYRQLDAIETEIDGDANVSDLFKCQAAFVLNSFSLLVEMDEQ